MLYSSHTWSEQKVSEEASAAVLKKMKQMHEVQTPPPRVSVHTERGITSLLLQYYRFL